MCVGFSLPCRLGTAQIPGDIFESWCLLDQGPRRQDFLTNFSDVVIHDSSTVGEVELGCLLARR